MQCCRLWVIAEELGILDKLCRRVNRKVPCGAGNGVESKLNLAKCASFTEVDTRAETVDKLMGGLDGCDQVIAKMYHAQWRVTCTGVC